MKKFLTVICAALLMVGCADNSQATSEGANTSINIKINGKTFKATLEDNPSAQAFAEMLPLAVEMIELNGNEKYFHIDKDLPTESVRVSQIHAGDLMLYGSNCVVIFYKDFSTSYSYTRLGNIENPSDLEETLGDGNVTVKFEE